MLNRYINIGIWVCTFLGVGVVTYNVVTSRESSSRYALLFNESVGGLYSGSEVFLNGMQIGSVESLDMYKQNVSRTLVVVKTRPLQNPARLRAEVSLRGVTGHSCVSMYYAENDENLEPINGVPQVKVNMSFLTKIRSKFDSLAAEDTIETVVKSVSDTIDSVKFTFTELRNVLIKLNSFIDNVDSVVQEAPETMKKLNQALDSTNRFIKNLDNLVKDSYLPVLLNQDLKKISFTVDRASSNLKKASEEFNKRPLGFLTSGLK